MKIITRKEAQAQGLVRYSPGSTCVKGHVAERLTASGSCCECIKERAKQYYHANNGKEKQKTDAKRKIKADWRKKNKGRVNSWTAKRYAAKLQRTPKWLTEDDLWIIEEAYVLAQLRQEVTGIQWSVDHIIPMQGDTVSGFHSPNNIRVIPQLLNSQKSNRWDWDTQQ